MAELTEAKFLQTFQAPMQDVTEAAEASVDIWFYVDAIPSQGFDAHQLLDGAGQYVYRDALSRFDQVFVPTNNADVFLVVVADLEKLSVHGHHLLNLPEPYKKA
jgi:hypothetical protein